MALTLEEEKELAELEAMESPSSGLSPDEQKELTELEAMAAPAPAPEARKPRFDFEAANPLTGGDPLVGGAKLALQGLGSVADLVKAGTDKITAGVPLSESLDRYYKNDPTYTPGDATVEKFIPNNVIGQTVAKSGLDIASDPTTWAAAYAKAAPKLAKLFQQAEKQSPGLGLKTLGKVGEFFTGGRMGPKWPQATAKFTPKERIFSGKTLDDAADAYSPLKKAADDFMSKRLSPLAEETFQPVSRVSAAPLGAATEGLVKAGETSGATLANPKFQTLDEAVQYFDDAMAKLSRMRNGADAPAELQAIQNGLHEIQSRGVTAGPETAELMDFINNIEFTGMGNPKLTKDILKGPQAAIRGALRNLTEESGPTYSAARQLFSDAKTMAAPPYGGRMGKNMIQNAPTMAATAGVAGEAIGGNWGNAAKVAGSILGLRNPKAYNIAAGVGGGVNQGLKTAMSAIGSGVTSQVGKQAIVQSTKVDFGKMEQVLANNPNFFGQYAPTLQDAAQRGPAALSAVNHVLSQQHEEYRAKQRELNNQEIE